MNYCCAGIVLYNPDIFRLKENIKAIINQIDKIIIVDNNSTNIESVCKEFDDKDKFIIIRNNRNEGIAKALNQICEKALNLKYDWVLLLDQDSICSPNIVKGYKSYINDSSIALLTPYIVDINKSSIEEYSKLDLSPFSEVDWAITSGSLIRLTVWKNVGGFFEELFIDVVDFDYSMRLKINDYKQIRVNSEYLLQEVGQAEKTPLIRIHKDNSGKWSLKPYYRTNHSLLRQYYMTRNHLIFYKKYFNYISSIKYLLFILVMILPKPFFEKNKLKLIKIIIRGIYHGLKFKVEKYKKL